MFKKAIMLALTAALLLSFSALPSFAASSTSAEFVIGMNQYFVNSQTPGVSMDAAPYIDTGSGRTLVPVRYLGNALGATTGWDAGSQTVTVTGGSTTVSLVIGSTAMTVNGQAQTLDQAPAIKDGRTYLPARWVANALGYQVDWNAANKIVIIWPQGTSEPGIVGTVNNGFVIPSGTNLTVSAPIPTTTPDYKEYVLLDFQIDGSKGNVQGQVADAQTVLSQAQGLDAATVAKAMNVITNLTTIQNPVWNDFGDFNSPNGGCITVHSEAFGMNKGYCMIDIQVWPQHELFPHYPTE